MTNNVFRSKKDEHDKNATQTKKTAHINFRF